MTEPIAFDRSHPGPYGVPITVSPLVRRVVANNPGPLTFTGIVTHIIGRGQVAILDPGPDDGDHLAALMAATAGEDIGHILVSHTHRDHIDGIEALRAATGAEVLGCGPHIPFRPLLPDEARIDPGYQPDRELKDGEILSGRGWTIEAVATPGHTMNHLAFALREEKAIFSGDHVMAWSTTVVAPPYGSMKAYKASLRKLLSRPEDVYYPAHGPSLANAHPYVAALLRHREDREKQILAALAAGPISVSEIVEAIYEELGPRLKVAAGLSVLAHLEELIGRGEVRREAASGSALFFLAGRHR